MRRHGPPATGDPYLRRIATGGSQLTVLVHPVWSHVCAAEPFEIVAFKHILRVRMCQSARAQRISRRTWKTGSDENRKRATPREKQERARMNPNTRACLHIPGHRAPGGAIALVRGNRPTTASLCGT